MVSLLREQKQTFREPFEGFVFTRFDGTRITIGGARRVHNLAFKA